MTSPKKPTLTAGPAAGPTVNPAGTKTPRAPVSTCDHRVPNSDEIAVHRYLIDARDQQYTS